MILGLVCARKGSVGLPDKNVRELKGVKLIERAIIKATDAVRDRVAVCSDYTPHEFETMGAQWIPRPPHLAGPDVSKWDVWRDAVAIMEAEHGTADIIVDIDVTRPLCTAETVRACIAMVEAGAPAAMAVAESNKHPAFDIVFASEEHGVFPYDSDDFDEGYPTSRQQCGPVYQHAGCYAFTREALYSRTGIFDGPITPVIVDRIQSYDIDDELDWRIVEALA
jgi:CMP-N-acetylneuraminic acid synthetase